MSAVRSWGRTRSAVRVLGERELPEVMAILDRDPVANVFVAARVHACGLHPRRLGAEIWGYFAQRRLVALCYAGANLVPVGAGDEAAHAFAERARRQGRRCSSIVGPARAVATMWQVLEPAWGPARAVRRRQPVLSTASRPGVPADPRVRRVQPGELDVLLPACVAMFTEEVGVSPNGRGGGSLYRARVNELIHAGRAYARISGGRVEFKAEIGAVTPRACQVQGVWVPPELRGQRRAVSGMAAVIGQALDSVAPLVTLYVNDFNGRARTVYDRVGMAEAGMFTSVLF